METFDWTMHRDTPTHIQPYLDDDGNPYVPPHDEVS